MIRLNWRRLETVVAAVVGLVLAGCGGGGDNGGGDPTGPDNAGAQPVGAISVFAGNNQAVGPGEVVPVRPVLKVTSDRGRPLQGATVTFTIEGNRGMLDAAAVTTDASGEAVVPRWVAPLLTGEFALNATAAGANSSTASTRVVANVTDAQVQSISQTVGSGGGTISIPASVPPLGGLQITIPPASFPGNTTFSIAYGTAPQLPSHLTLASPLIGISAGNVMADSIVYVTIPTTLTKGAGQAIRAFVLATDNSLIPVSTYTSTNSSVMVGIRDFRPQAADPPPLTRPRAQTPLSATGVPAVVSTWGIRLLLALWTLPTTGTFGPDFQMQRDNVAFANYGSFGAPGGYCGGASILSGGWFLRSPSVREKYAPLMTPEETGGWGVADQLNPAIRLATELQKQFAPVDVSIGSDKFNRMVQHDKSIWENIVYQLQHGSRPVYINVWSANRATGHAVLGYKVDVGTGTVYVADPNYPERLDRVMQWDRATETWGLFSASATASSANVPYLQFADGTYFFRESIADITSVMASYQTNGLLAQYPRAAANVTLASGTVVSLDNETSTFDVQSRDRELRLMFPGITNGAIETKNVTNNDMSPAGGWILSSAASWAPVKLQSGVNKIAVVVQRQTGTAPNLTNSWFDVKVLNVTRAEPRLSFLTQPSNAETNASLGSVVIGTIDEANAQLFDETRDLTVTLIGGTAGAVLTGGGAVSLTFGQVTLDALSVDKSGTGYQLQVSSPGLATITSAPFNITAPPGVPVSGRVINATNSVGLGGVSIVVTNGTRTYNATSNASGDWSIESVVEAGGYSVTASLTGFVSTTLVDQTVAAPGTVVEQIPLVPDATPGGVFGSIRNATTAQLIMTLTTVEARLGMNNTTGPVTFSQNTSTGSYALPNLPAGVYTLTATNPNFVPTTRTGVVVGGGQVVQGPDLVMSPANGVARIILTWGSSPNDLDSHLTGPTSGGTRFWAYYGSRGSCVQSPWVCLDVDDQSGHGPETMTFQQITPGVYRYYIYDYSNRTSTSSTALGRSGAKVEFYVGNTRTGVWFVPSGVGNAWAVFTWDGITVTPLNQLYTINGVPQPARVVGPLAEVLAELNRLGGLPAKLPQ
jgi:hypothetical protein